MTEMSKAGSNTLIEAIITGLATRAAESRNDKEGAARIMPSTSEERQSTPKKTTNRIYYQQLWKKQTF